jgi:hypothetical protein
MEPSGAAELKGLLVGVGLPADKAQLLEYAVRQHADPQALAALRSLPERRYESLDEVVEDLLHVQPVHLEDDPSPHEESGAPPGGDDYIERHPTDTGAVRDLDSIDD